MIRYTITENKSLTSLDAPAKGCWISLISPTEEEILQTAEQCQVDADALRAALDPEERSRIETDETYTMILVNIPTIVTANQKELYDTIPLAVILADEKIITVCSQHSPILRQFEENKVRDFSTAMRSRFLLQILFRVNSLYLQYLRSIDKRSEQVEAKLQRTTKNRELIEVYRLEKSLLYFTTSLRSNESVLEKMLRIDSIKKYPEDAELLDDVIVENKQAIEMANIYSGILRGTMDVFASVISNNLNIVMKVLSIVTIVMAIPTIIFSAYGMNVNPAGMPFATSPAGFGIILGIAAAISAAAGFILAKMNILR
jgi:magnesium transporter